MADRRVQHRRVHNILQFQKLLSLREGTSPFTLIIDTVEQPARPLMRHFIKNAKSSNIHVVLISFETPSANATDIDKFIRGPRKPIDGLQQEIRSACSGHKHTLLIFDTLHPLCASASASISIILTPLITPTTILLAVYHTDIPMVPSLTHTNTAGAPYQPAPLTTLRYLATSILKLHSFPQTLARKHAANNAKPEPLFGIDEEREGVIIGLTPSLQGFPLASLYDGSLSKGKVVVEMEYRRRSGRAVEETFILPSLSSPNDEKVTLLADHPLWTSPGSSAVAGEAGDGDVTFKLGLSAKEKSDREGVVLPYYDAQRTGGDEEEGGRGGGGGRIVYEMGVEDDFDEEEDEI